LRFLILDSEISKGIMQNTHKRDKPGNHHNKVTYIFQPAFPMFVFIDVWRMTPKLIWAINPNIAFHYTFFGMSCMIQASLTAISCTIFVVSKTPSYCSTVIIGVMFCIALRWKGFARKNLLIWIELIQGKYKE